jgi:hypothetical protein
MESHFRNVPCAGTASIAMTLVKGNDLRPNAMHFLDEHIAHGLLSPIALVYKFNMLFA